MDHGTFVTTIDEDTGFRLGKMASLSILAKTPEGQDYTKLSTLICSTPNSQLISTMVLTVGWTGIGTQVVGQRHPSVGSCRVGYASPAEHFCPLCLHLRGDTRLLVK